MVHDNKIAYWDLKEIGLVFPYPTSMKVKLEKPMRVEFKSSQNPLERLVLGAVENKGGFNGKEILERVVLSNGIWERDIVSRGWGLNWARISVVEEIGKVACENQITWYLVNGKWLTAMYTYDNHNRKEEEEYYNLLCNTIIKNYNFEFL